MAEEKEYTFYKIVCKDENIKDIYVGKTTNLKERIRKHKEVCNNENHKDYNIKLYEFIRNNGGFDNYIFVELEKDYYCDKDSSIRERFWINELKATLNKIIPTRTLKEYRENNKDEIKLKNKEYREKNKDEILLKNKEYYENNKDEIKLKNKEYREKNKEKILLKKKEYYEKNKEKIKERLKEYCEKNKDEIKEKVKEYREKNKDEINRKARENYKNKRFNKLSNENIE